MVARVLVTRPEPGAAATAERLRRLGFEPVVLPLTRIVRLDCPPVDTARLDALAITSANAVRMAPAALLARVAQLPVHVVGGRTAEAARAAGLAVTVTEPDADRLAGRIVSALEPGSRLLYLAGRERTPGFEASLRASGIALETREVYAAEALEPDPADLGGEPIDAALVYSARAAMLLGRLVADARCTALDATRLLALSPAVADALPPGRPVVVAGRPDEETLLALLVPPP